MKKRTAIKGLSGVVILYCPDGTVRDNIRTYSDILEKLWVIDNTEGDRQDMAAWFADRENIEIIQDGINAGIGARINTAI
ncbi:MAG TPA: hypothetical protein VG605_16870, partial [Puia sp.]|nr:hypothetical protein [Puia sp.]